MKRYSLWVKCLAFFVAVVTLLCVAVSALGILMAESECMYTHDDYDEWLYGQYQDRARTIADQVILDYGGSLSNCPQWLLDQTGHLNAASKVAGWYNLTEDNWCYSIQKDGKILHNTRDTDFEPDALHFAFGMELHYPVMTTVKDNVEYFIDPANGEPVGVS